MPYMRTLAFMERGMLCIVMIVVEENSIDARNFTRLEFSNGPSGGWLEECDNGVANYRESLG